MIGSTISHYKILEKLGEGGMGVVYKARDNRLDRFVALKFLPPHLAASPSEKARFVHEARAASALDHPNICTIHEIGETEDGALYISMAYYEGETLRQKIANGPLPIEKALDFAIQIGRGLSNAHDKGMVHRDIKPANVLITSDNVVKIVDFGLAKLPGRAKMTKTGSTMGTAGYMSPEQALGENVDHRTDIWSFGVVLYEMLTGELPFKSDYEQALVYSILNEKPRPVSALRPDIPATLDTVVQKCLEKETTNRYRNVSELLTDFYRIKGLPVGPSLRLALAKGRLRPFTTGVGLIIGAMLLIAGYFYVSRFLEPTLDETQIPKISLAVMTFDNLVDPEDKDRTGGILSNLLITSLSQLKALQVTSRERLQNILVELGHPDAKTLSPSLTAQVAQRASVKAFVAGSILQTHPTLAVTLQLVDVESGSIIGSQRVAGFTPEQIFALVDTLAMLLTNDLKVAPLSPGERKPVAEITTRSPAAYRAYLEGMEYWSNLYVPEARSAFEQAIELDTSFIEAYYRRSGLRVSGGRPYLEKAVQLSERAIEPLRMLIRADQYSILEENPKKGVETLEKLISLYPRDEYAYVSLFFTYRSLLEHEKALEAVRRGSKVNPSSLLLLIGISYQAAYLNHEKEALEASSEYLRLSPRAPDPYATRGDIFSLLGKYDSSRVWYERGYALRRQYVHVNLINDAVAREDYKTAMNYIEADEWNGSWHIFLIGLHRGQQRSARERLMKALEEQKSKNLSADRNNTYRELIHLTYEQGDHKEMLRLSREANIGKDYLAWALFKAGEKSEAQKLLEELKDEVNPNLPLTQVVHDYRSALLAYEEKLFGKAVVHFRRAYRRLPPNRNPNLFFAVSLSKNGEVDAAVQELLRLTQWYPLGLHTEFIPDAPGQHRYWPISQVKAWYWLGLVYEQQGEKVKAITSFKKFLDLWKAADFKSEEIEDAKIRVAKLKTLVMK